MGSLVASMEMESRGPGASTGRPVLAGVVGLAVVNRVVPSGCHDHGSSFLSGGFAVRPGWCKISRGPGASTRRPVPAGVAMGLAVLVDGGASSFGGTDPSLC